MRLLHVLQWHEVRLHPTVERSNMPIYEICYMLALATLIGLFVP
jgi:hypothetical protein